ncbi:YkvA family protein [Streptomyces sp. NPDC012769]|uniref:YkvA family protein n=1 Tax=Streptomyces sp. NPDC012769 TaxID=3364848 RepID=UPI00369FD9CF
MDSTAWLVVAAVLALAVAACAAVLLIRVLRTRRLLQDAGVPLQSKALFWSAVVYTVSPIDLIPDPVYLDDIGVLLLALRALHAAAARSGVDATGQRGSRRGFEGVAGSTKEPGGA